MFWADRTALTVAKKYEAKITSGKPLVIHDEKTASGRVHVGSLRGVAVHGIMSEVLLEKGIKNTFLYEINDFDPMDGLPTYLDEKKYKEHMGKPLYAVPSPDGKAKNFAEYFGQEFIAVIEDLGFQPEFYRLFEQYKAGKFNTVIRLALENVDIIRAIYRDVSGSVKDDDWMPLQVVCEKCGKIGTTKVQTFDGEKVTYMCAKDLVVWAQGCGHAGMISPYDGNAKLPWKVEWAAKFAVFDVDIEGAGKDHSTKGGSRDIAEAIAKKVFNHQPPFNIPYEFLHVEGKKMSSSKGTGVSSREMADLLPKEILRLLLLKEPKRVVDFVPDGDTVPVLYDTYDRMAKAYFAKEENDNARIFQLLHDPQSRAELKDRFLPRFSQIAFLVQMPHVRIYDAVSAIKKSELTKEDKKEVDHRAKYAKLWLGKYAPEEQKFELYEKAVPDAVKGFTKEQKKALTLLLTYVRSKEKLDGQELHTKLHEIKEETGIAPEDFFSAIYLSFLGKSYGPKAGWFFSVLDKPFLEKRLQEVITEGKKYEEKRS